MNEEDFYTEDHSCIHCDYTVYYYSEVKDICIQLMQKWNASNPEDEYTDDWKAFEEEAIAEAIQKDDSIRTTCINCDSPYSYL